MSDNQKIIEDMKAELEALREFVIMARDTTSRPHIYKEADDLIKRFGIPDDGDE